MPDPDDVGTTPRRAALPATRPPTWHVWIRNRAVRAGLATATVGSIAVIAVLALHAPVALVESGDELPIHRASASEADPAASPYGASAEAASAPAAPSLSPSATPTSSPTATSSTASVQHLGWTLRIDALGLVTRIDGMTAHNGVVDPPTLDAAYWLSQYGAPSATAKNTVYIAGHSWSHGSAVFNAFSDAASQQGRVPVGATIVVDAGDGPLTYVVDATARYPKSQLTTTKDVWAIIPGRLVLITCFLHEGAGHSPDNYVVFAHLATPSG